MTKISDESPIAALTSIIGVDLFAEGIGNIAFIGAAVDVVSWIASVANTVCVILAVGV